MPEYRLKSPQGSIPADTIFRNWEGYIEASANDNNTTIMYDNNDIPKLIEQGIIEEVPELKYTKDDMIEFAKVLIGELYQKEIEDYIYEKKLNYFQIAKRDEQSIQTKNT